MAQHAAFPLVGALKKCPEPESNQRHEDFQSSALPTELSGHLVHVNIIISGRILQEKNVLILQNIMKIGYCSLRSQ